MKKGIIGKKLGMTQIFDEKGNVIPVTLIEAGPCVVAQKKTIENDGYNAVQLASIRVTGITLPFSSKIWVIPSFLPIMPFFIFPPFRLLVDKL